MQIKFKQGDPTTEVGLFRNKDSITHTKYTQRYSVSVWGFLSDDHLAAKETISVVTN